MGSSRYLPCCTHTSFFPDTKRPYARNPYTTWSAALYLSCFNQSAVSFLWSNHQLYAVGPRPIRRSLASQSLGTAHLSGFDALLRLLFGVNDQKPPNKAGDKPLLLGTVSPLHYFVGRETLGMVDPSVRYPLCTILFQEKRSGWTISHF